mgnify:CR=1 FL=1
MGSSDVSAGDTILASQQNDLRDDIIQQFTAADEVFVSTGNDAGTVRTAITQALATAGTSTVIAGWTPLRVKQAIDALGVPNSIDFLVGTATGNLSSEIVAGTAPAGELGGTWASPTVDGTHSGSAHHADAHTVASHSDTTGTGAELNTLTDGSNTSLHTHTHTVLSHSDGADACKIATGSYTGDGSTSQAITGVGFTVKFLWVWPRGTAETPNINTFVTTDTIVDDNASGQSYRWGGGTQFAFHALIALGSDGFTVDDAGVDAAPNKNTEVYNYLAIGIEV